MVALELWLQYVEQCVSMWLKWRIHQQE